MPANTQEKKIKGINEKYFKVKEVGIIRCKMQSGERQIRKAILGSISNYLEYLSVLL